jgi:hypothetical protein
MRFALALLLSTFVNAAFADAPKYRVLAADKGKIFLVGADGKLEWSVDNATEVHDVQRLANGNFLFPTSRTTVVEMTPEKKIVWSYTAKAKAGYTGAIEIHACQRLDDGLTMVAESGNARIVEVDSAGKIAHEVPLTVDKPNAHRDTRMVRKLKNGYYLVCHEGDGKVREYDRTGKVVWTYTLDLAGRPASDGHGTEAHGTAVYGAVRLNNGNTLIACGNGNRVIEVSPEGKTVWALEQRELPGITLAWVTTLHVLPNGNVIVGNCHAGPDNPQLFEVTRDKKVVWKFRDFTTFGNSLAASHILDTAQPVIR